MAVQNVSRKVGPMTGNGILKEFPFSFKVIRAADVVVKVASGEEVTDEERTLVLGTDYTVTLNDDQDERAGGAVVFTSAPAQGARIAITSDTEIDQQTVLTNHDGFLPETLNDAYDKLTIICQELKETLGRCLIVPITSEKAPTEVMSELLDVAAKAQEYAERAEQIYNEVKNTELYVSTTWADIQQTKNTIDLNKAAIDAMVARAEEILARNEVIGTHVDALYPHIDDLEAISGHVDEVHKVGQDLMTTESGTIDLGSITDPFVDTASTVVGGYIKKVAEHIDDCIHPVGAHIDDVEQVAENTGDINVVAKDLQGKTTLSPTLDLGSITEDTEDYEETTVEGGYLKKVAEHVDCCIHPIAEHLDEIVKAPEYAASAAESAAAAVEAAETAVSAKDESEAILNRMIENETVDYVKVFEDALAGNTEAASNSDFVQIFESALN